MLAAGFLLAVHSVGCQAPEPDAAAREARPPADTTQATATEARGFLYGRVTTYDGTVYEGRLRWGGGEEAFWSDTFNGVKDENPWAALTPLRALEVERRPIKVFGVEIPVPWREAPVDLRRPFLARFGDIARVEARGDGIGGMMADGVEFDPDVRVTLRSGTAFDLDRLSASDFDDGVRVWDGRRGVVDLGPRDIRVIEFLPTARIADVPEQLHGTVRTHQGDFTGFLSWNRDASVGSDRLVGHTADGEVGVRFDAIGSIARLPGGGVRVTRRDGREIVLDGASAVGSRGVTVDDSRYGRVLVSRGTFERVDFSPTGGSGPAYGDFPPGLPLAGTVTTRDGRRLSGRLVYDLDESETTETLDAPAGDVDYSLPFARIASITLPGGGESATVRLQSGEELTLERAGDLGAGNAGLLVFSDGRNQPEYLPWADIQRVDLERLSAPRLPSRSPTADSTS